jgi:Ribbon-helix-helix protein, copG family.
MRLSISMPDSLVPEVDAYASKLNLNRSAAISMMVSEYMRGLSAVDAVSKLAGMFEKYQADGTLPTDEALSALEQPAPSLSSKKSRPKKKA